MTSLQDLEHAVVETEEWIDDLLRRIDWHDRSNAYSALIGTLHGLRDCLPRDETVHVGSQLPPLLRGLYYEGWHPAARVSAKNRSAFPERISEAVQPWCRRRAGRSCRLRCPCGPPTCRRARGCEGRYPQSATLALAKLNAAHIDQSNGPMVPGAVANLVGN